MSGGWDGGVWCGVVWCGVRVEGGLGKCTLGR